MSEKLLYSTVRLETPEGNSGTGFFFQFKFEEKFVPIIVTNKHVINHDSSKEIKFFLHVYNKNPAEGTEKFGIDFKTNWYFHKTEDLCFCFVAPLFETIRKEAKKEVFFAPLGEDLIFQDKDLEDLRAIEDAIMVGYPIGLWDEKNNLPLFRKGITSTHPAIDFNGESKGVVDMACFPGSSGSPIFIFNENNYSTKKGSFFGKGRLILLGILFAGPQMSSRGSLIVEEIPTNNKQCSITPVMINLGYYIKAKALQEFKGVIKEALDKGKH